MKKTIISVLMCMLTIPLVYSQELSAGFKAGANFSTLKDSPGAETLTGLQAGGFLVYSFQEHFGISLDALYSGEGAKYNDQKLRMNYLRLPLLANIFFGSLGDKYRPKISFGPSFGFLLSAKGKTIVGDQSVVMDIDKDNFNTFDFGAIAGAGLNINIGEMKWLNLDARYGIGASDVNKNPAEGAEKVKNSGFSVTAGLAFGLSDE
jgi:hypothetical protein